MPRIERGEDLTQILPPPPSNKGKKTKKDVEIICGNRRDMSEKGFRRREEFDQIVQKHINEKPTLDENKLKDKLRRIIRDHLSQNDSDNNREE